VSKLKAIIDSGIRAGVDKSQPPRQMPDEAARQGIRAFHGSPHDFPPVRELEMPDGAVVYQHMDDAVPEGAQVIAEHPLGRFDMSKLGTGEGAQAYGQGLYFAESEDLARGYRDQLTKPRVQRAQRLLSNSGNDVDLAIENAKKEIDRLKSLDLTPETGSSKRESLISLQEEKIAELTKLKNTGQMSKGSMYEVNIDATPDDFLDYDKPLSEQSDRVKEALGIKGQQNKLLALQAKSNELQALYDKALSNVPSNQSFDDLFGDSAALRSEGELLTEKNRIDEEIKLLTTPKDFQLGDRKIPIRVQDYFSGANLIQGQGAASEISKQLLDKGIKGIKYLDQGSRAAGKGTSNYVVFDDKLISIAKKYGISIPLASAVIAGTVTPEEAQAMTKFIPRPRRKKVHKAVNPFHNMQPEVRFNLYSKAEQVALSMRQAKQLGADAKRHFEKKGVTKEEMEALGLTDLFKQKRVTQQEIMEAIEDNRLVLEEKQSSEHGYVGDPDVDFKTETLSAEDAYGSEYLEEQARELIGYGGIDRSEFIPIFDKWAETSPYGVGDGPEASLARAAADFSKFVDGELELEDLNGAIQNEILEAAEETARLLYDENALEVISFTPQGSDTTYRLVGNEEWGYESHGQDRSEWQPNQGRPRAMMDDYVPAQGIFSRDEAEVILRAAAQDRGDLSAGDGGTQWSEFTIPGGKNYTEYRFQLDPDNEEFFRESTHFDDDVNNIFHIRTTDRDGPEGEKVLFVEEIQSDWAQSGRNYGFKDQSLIDQNQALLLEQLPQDIKSMIVDEQKLRVARDSGSILAGDIAEALDLAGSTDRKLFPEINRQTRSLRKLMGAKRALEELRPRSRIAKRFVEERAKTMSDDDKIRWVERYVYKGNFDADPESFEHRNNALLNYDQLVKNQALQELRYAEEMGGVFGTDNKTGKLLNKVKEDIAKEDSQKLLDAGLPENFESLLDAAIEKNRPMLNAIEGETGKPQAAPFVTKTDGWNKLAVKRIMNKAAKEGYDMVAFSSGDIQFKRWKNEGLKKEYDVVLPGLIKTVAGKKPDLKIQVGEGSESYQVPAIRLDDKVGKQTVRERSLSPQTMFSTGAGITALGAASLLAPDQAEAGGLGSLPAATKEARAESVKQAKEQGYDLKNVMYHASKQDIKEFVPGYSDGLVFLTPSKEFANNWLGKGKFQERQGGTGAIEGVRAEKKRWREEADKILKSLPEDQRQQYYEEILNPQQQQLLKDERLADSAIYPVVTRTKKPFVPSKNVDVLEELYSKEYLDAPFGSGFPTYRDALKDGNYLLYEKKEVVDFLKSKGYDSMFLKESSGADKPFTTLAVFEPNNIRSVNAKFDPEKKDSPQILASAPFAAGAAGLGAAAMLSPEQAQAQTLNASGFNLQYPIKPKKESPGVASLAGQLGLGAMSEIAGTIFGGAAGVDEYLRHGSTESIRDAREGTSEFVGGLYDAGPEAQQLGQEAVKGIAGIVGPTIDYAMEGPVMDERGLNVLPLIAKALNMSYEGWKEIYDLLPEREQEAVISAADAFL
jgi:hypothetical protein